MRLKYTSKCKEAARKRCGNEYLVLLGKEYNLKYSKRYPENKVGEIVVIKWNEQNKAK